MKSRTTLRGLNQRRRPFTSWVAIVAIPGIVALVGTGCGGGSTGPESKSGPSDVSIMVIAPLTGANGVFNPWVNAVKASVAAANAQGGNHQIKLNVCDAGESANSSISCAQDAVQNGDVGVIDMLDSVGPIAGSLDKAHIPRFGFMSDPIDTTDQYSFDTGDGGGSVTYGSVGLAKKLSCNKLSMVREDPGSASEVSQFTSNFLKDARAEQVQATLIPVPPTATDYASYVAKGLASQPQCLLLEGYGDAPEIGLLQAAAQLAPSNVQLMTLPSLVSPAGIKSLGSRLDRVVAASFDWPISSLSSHPALKDFKQTIEKYAPKPNVLDANSELMWSQTNALIDAIDNVKGNVTPSAVYASLNNFHNYNTGIGPPVSFDQKPSPPVPPRVFAPYGIQEKFQNGSPVAVGNFYNIYTGEPVSR